VSLMPDGRRPAALILQNARMLIDAVIFDIGDVLEINPATGWQQRWSQRLGLDLDEFERRLGELWAQGPTGGQDLASIERATAEAFGLDDAGLRALMDDVWEEYVGSLNLELVDYFRALRPRYKTAILSNSFVGAREREHDAHQLADLCDLIVYSHEEGCRKPDPQIYRIVCQRLNIAPEAAVFLDDLQENIDGALNIGMNAIRFDDNAQAISELEALLAAPGA
jgi:epoxide hydrolase-like predicted phosphatase